MKYIPYPRAFTQYFAGTQEGAGKIYPWLHQAAIQEGFQNLTGQSLTETCPHMSLTRSTFAGGQRYCSYMWSGDTLAEFPVLTQQITGAVSAAAAGISSWTLDIGGFTGLDIDADWGKELYVRWFGMAVFLPYTRTHGDRICNLTSPAEPYSANNCPNEPWSYGEDNFVILKKYINQRYELVPYVKALFQHLHESGKSIMRALYYDFSSDPFVVQATSVNNPLVVEQYMFGPRILVAPVSVENATEKEVYLPRLTQSMIAQNYSWTHWWTNQDYGQGGNTVNVSAPLDEIPVFYLGSKADIFSGNI